MRNLVLNQMVAECGVYIQVKMYVNNYPQKRELWDKLQNILDFDIPYSKICQTF